MIHTGKNLFRLPDSVGDTIVSQGITFSINRSNGEITANGTATGNAFCNFKVPRNIPEGRYIVSGCPNGGGGSIYFIEVDYINASGSEQWPKSTSSNSNGVVTISGNAYIKGAYISVRSGTTVNNVVFKPMFFRSDETSAKIFQYEPYYLPDVYAAKKNRNLVSFDADKKTTFTTNGMTFTGNSDGSVTLNGTATALTWYVFHRDSFILQPGTYTASLSGGNNQNIVLYNDSFGFTGLGSSTTKTFTAPTSGNVSLRITSGTTASNLTVYPQIESGPTATKFESFNEDLTPRRLYSIYKKSDNMLPIADGSITINGLTATVEEGVLTLDGSVSTNGFYLNLTNLLEGKSAVGGPTSEMLKRQMLADRKGYTITLKKISGTAPSSACAFRIYQDTGTYVKQWYLSPGSQTFTFTDNGKLSCFGLYVNTGLTFDNAKFELSITKNATVSQFRPYLKRIHSIVPDGYQALEYIKTNGDTMFDTDFRPNQSSKIIFDIAPTALSESTPFGVYEPNKHFFINFASNEWIFPYYGNGRNTGVTIEKVSLNKRHQLIYYKGGLVVDGKRQVPEIEGLSFQCSVSMYLMTRHIVSGTTERRQTYGSIYSCQIFDNGTIVRDYIPVKTTKATTDYDGNSVAVGTLGLFDKVSGKMFVNKGTGTFTAGPEL